jgi:hypothetical protein
MKLHGIILPTSLAVSTPTIVPAGAFWATVKLLIVIVINLSGWSVARHSKSTRICRAEGVNAINACIYTHYNNVVNRNDCEGWIFDARAGGLVEALEFLPRIGSARAPYAVVTRRTLCTQLTLC